MNTYIYICVHIYISMYVYMYMYIHMGCHVTHVCDMTHTCDMTHACAYLRALRSRAHVWLDSYVRHEPYVWDDMTHSCIWEVSRQARHPSLSSATASHTHAAPRARVSASGHGLMWRKRHGLCMDEQWIAIDCLTYQPSLVYPTVNWLT